MLPVSVNVGQPISHRLDHMLSGIRAEIALKIFGDDLDTMRKAAEDLRGKLAAIPGLADLQVEKAGAAFRSSKSASITSARRSMACSRRP